MTGTPLAEADTLAARPDAAACAAPHPPQPRPAPAATPFVLALGLGLTMQGLTSTPDVGFGLNLPVWVALFVGVCLWALRRRAGRPTHEGLTLLGAALLFALTFAVRDVNGTLGGLNALALWLSLTLGAAFLRSGGVGRWSVVGLLGAGVTGALRFVYGPLALLERLPWAWLRPAGARGLGRWGVGTLLALPVLLVFGGLLTSADAGFRDLVGGVLDWRLDELWRRGLELTLWCAFAGGLIYPALMALRPSVFPRSGPDVARLGLVETGLPLASLAGLFVVFVLTQLPYMLSGSGLPDGVTFAGYIREGFGQLLAVAFLTLTLLLGAHALTRPEVRGCLAYRLLNLAVLLPLALVLLSAAHRWRLYTLAYGLSDIRVTGAAFLIWLTLSLTLLGWLLWRSQPQRFAYPALLLGFGVLLATTALNPGALIARVNVARQTAGVMNTQRDTPQEADVWTLLALGAGAVPTVVAHLDALTRDCAPGPACPDSRQAVINRLHERYDTPRDLRAWNASFARAHALVRTLPPPTPEPGR